MAALVTVAGRFELPDHTPADVGSMTFWLTPSDIPDTAGPVVVLPGPVVATIDDTGAFTVAVRATDDPDLVAHVDGPVAYRVRRQGRIGFEDWTVTVPAPGPWDWAQLSPQTLTSPLGTVTPVPGPTGPPGPAGAGAVLVEDPPGSHLYRLE
jgi:hypothetical protein